LLIADCRLLIAMRVLVSIQQPVKQWQIPPACVDALRRRFPNIEFIHATTDQQRADALKDCEVVYTWILKAAELAAAPHVKWVHTSAVAVETLCLTELFARGIAVSNTRGVQAVPIAEHVMAVVLALAKQLPFALESQRAARWAQNEFIDDRLPWLLKGRTLGVIGLGTIGSEIAARAHAFGMNVIAMRRRVGSTFPGIDRIFGPEQLYQFLSQCHVLVIAAPLTPQTLALLGAGQFSQLPKGAIVVNVGRAKIIDTDALVDALKSGHLGGASLDVFPQEPLPADHPLWKAPNVILTPHTSGFRQGHWDEVIELFAENIERYQRGEPLKFRVDPDLGY
jgi:phosphoglycerate dehydrogenase-like enzyme